MRYHQLLYLAYKRYHGALPIVLDQDLLQVFLLVNLVLEIILDLVLLQKLRKRRLENFHIVGDLLADPTFGHGQEGSGLAWDLIVIQ